MWLTNVLKHATNESRKWFLINWYINRQAFIWQNFHIGFSLNYSGLAINIIRCPLLKRITHMEDIIPIYWQTRKYSSVPWWIYICSLFLLLISLYMLFSALMCCCSWTILALKLTYQYWTKKNRGAPWLSGRVFNMRRGITGSSPTRGTLLHPWARLFNLSFNSTSSTQEARLLNNCWLGRKAPTQQQLNMKEEFRKEKQRVCLGSLPASFNLYHDRQYFEMLFLGRLGTNVVLTTAQVN